jgi:predicted Zn finger-like uncharacterized protein
MTITCPSCSSKYRLQDSLIKSPYQKVRCSRCGHVFVYNEMEKNKEDKPVFSHPGIIEEENTKNKGKGRIRGAYIGAIVAIIVVILASYGYYWFNYPGASIGRLRFEKMEGQETSAKDGKVFLIKGLIYNGSTKARAFVMLKAKLFDTTGVVLNERAVLAGLQLTKADIEKMTKDDIEAKITAFRKTGGDAFVLRSHKEIPFVIAFMDTFPGKLKQFSMEILEAPRQ